MEGSRHTGMGPSPLGVQNLTGQGFSLDPDPLIHQYKDLLPVLRPHSESVRMSGCPAFPTAVHTADKSMCQAAQTGGAPAVSSVRNGGGGREGRKNSMSLVPDAEAGDSSASVGTWSPGRSGPLCP